MSERTYKQAFQGRAHKERSQPSGRQKLGFLEKHKDYVERAKDFHKKEKAIQLLREKADARNPDEFYFGMQRSKTKDGVHTSDSTEPNKYTQEQLLLMKTQDKKYIEMKAQMENKKVEKLKSGLHFLGAPAANKHTVFVDTEQERQAFKPEEYFDTSAEFLDRSFHRPRREQLEQDAPAALANRKKKKKMPAYKELAQRSLRVKEMEKLSQRMDVEKQVMGKGRKKRVLKSSEGNGIPVYRWKRERKK
mmetsp:Transcript_3181/g.7846  ORF Transcript_3181/g.7846 Transcript_3181/m.7846 type:complete len:248 (-) Transcript_3181:1141-1884(-)